MSRRTAGSEQFRKRLNERLGDGGGCMEVARAMREVAEETDDD